MRVTRNPTLVPVDPRRRSAKILHLDATRPTGDTPIEAGIAEVVVIPQFEGHVLGQYWVRVPIDRVLRAEQLWHIVQELSWPATVRVAERRIRDALGAPAPRTARRRSVAVVICTKDRSDQLRACIASVQGLNRAVELLVVDNASSDDRTHRVCEELGVRCVDEPVRGQTSARNRGFIETTAELVAFTDDDVTVSPDWLDEIDRPFEDPLVMIATGYIGPKELDAHEQVEFEAHGGFERHATRRVFDGCGDPTMLAAGSAGAGANMVMRRAAIEEIGWFDVEFGPGSPVRTADDKVYFYRTLRAGFRIEYDPSRRVWHQHRADRPALLRIMRDYGTGEFSWTSHVMRTYRDPAALVIWKWWLRHFAADVRRSRRADEQHGVTLDMTRSEILGALEARKALKGAAVARRTLPGPPAALPAGDDARRALAAIDVGPESPSVTVAIISHQRRDSLKTCLEHLDAQVFPAQRFEVVVVLDGSTDGSAEMVAAHDAPYDLRVEARQHMGVSGARNLTFDLARHPIVAMLDDDIDADPHWVAALSQAHTEHGADTWVFGDHPARTADTFSGQQTRRWWNDHLRTKGEPDHRWTMLDMVAGNSSLSKARFEALGGFDLRFENRHEDYELGWRHLQGGGRCAFAHAAQAVHRARASLDAQLRVAEQEGRDGVALVAKHPRAAIQLPLSDPELMRPLGTKARLLLSLGRPRLVRLAGQLERAQRRGEWDTLVSQLWRDHYRRGVIAGLEEHGMDTIELLPARRRLPVDLTPGAAPVVVPVDVHDIAFAFETDGRRIAVIPAVGPGLAFSWESVLERGAEATAGPLHVTGIMS